jgi:hypothetical protein
VDECLRGKFNVRLPALLFSRSVIDAAGPWNTTFSVSEDWDFVLRALEHARAAGDQRVALYYRRHPTSLSRAASIAAGEDARRRLTTAYFARHPGSSAALRRRVWSAMHVDSALAYWNTGRYGRSIHRLARALVCDPRTVGPQLARATAYRAYSLLRRR